jgi:hypothetical protein
MSAPPSPPGSDAAALLPVLRQVMQARTLVQAQFDAAHYRAQGPDLAPAGGDPLLHFLVWGWRDGLAPTPWFDVRFYLDAYPDVAATNQNPFVHYIRWGAREGRLPQWPASLWRGKLETARSARERLDQLAPLAVTASIIDDATLGMMLAEAGSRRGLVVAVSHDDYVEQTGGVENAVGDERLALADNGWGHLHVAPMRYVLRLADADPMAATVVRLRLDGVPLGTIRVADLLDAIRRLRGSGPIVRLVLHHLAGLAPEHLLALAGAAGDRRPVVWVHDFFTLCQSHALMRNNVAYCGAPPPDSMACAICCHGTERGDHLRRVHDLFAVLRPVVLAPSACALETWRRQGFAHAEAAVIPLASVQFPLVSDGAPPAETGTRPIRVAHIGARTHMKGWAAFESLVTRHAEDDRYAFFQLGSPRGRPMPPALRTVPVHVRSSNRLAMVEAIRAQAIDVVVIWSLCAETFCFTVHEALAAGAFVVARAGAGNVWPAIQASAPAQGLALTDVAALQALFAGDGLRDRLRVGDRRYGRLAATGGTATWLNRGVIGEVASHV